MIVYFDKQILRNNCDPDICLSCTVPASPLVADPHSITESALSFSNRMIRIAILEINP